MQLTGLHLLLTYRCDRACDHCFVWSGPDQQATMSLDTVRRALAQARDVGTVEWIYFEGGEPFLYYPVLVQGVHKAEHLGFRVGVVTNAYWATSLEDAVEWLWPFAGWVQDLAVSSDTFHSERVPSPEVQHAHAAAKELGIPTGLITIEPPGGNGPRTPFGQLPEESCAVMYRGRAAEKLAGEVPGRPWPEFRECPFEDLRNPGRVHLDPFGEVHLCQGISLGNIFRTPLAEILRTYDPDEHPIAGPLLRGGPAELVRRHGVPRRETYADACHLCYETRRDLRARFPQILCPAPMYGVLEHGVTV